MTENVLNFITALPTTEFVNVFYSFNLIPVDTDDNKFVDCAIAANAQYLISNDGHYEALLRVDFPKINWIKLGEFERQFKKQLTNETS